MELPFVSSLFKKQRRVKHILAVGGSKGGVGKTVVAVNLALTLSKMGHSVVLFDADLGNANCHTLLGIRHIDKSLDEYLLKGVSIDEIIVSSPFVKLRLICGASNKVDQCLRDEAVKKKLFDDLCELNTDYIIIDLGAGLGDDMLDLYNLADVKIMVTSPQFTALQNAYSFVKSAYCYEVKKKPHLGPLLTRVSDDPIKLKALIQKLPISTHERTDYDAVASSQRFSIIGNMAGGENDLKIIGKLTAIVKEFLNVDSNILGVLVQSSEVQGSINRLTPFMELFPNCENSQEMRTIALKLDGKLV